MIPLASVAAEAINERSNAHEPGTKRKRAGGSGGEIAFVF